MAHNPETETPSRVFVNGKRIPMGDLDVYVRKEGPLDVTRYVEGTFASPYKGEDYAGYFQGLEPQNQSSYDILRVELRDAVTEEYDTVFHGFVTGVGNTNGNLSEWEFRARGPGMTLNNIPASQTFTSASVDDVLRYVEHTVDDKLPINVEAVIGGQPLRNTSVEDVSEGIIDLIPILGSPLLKDDDDGYINDLLSKTVFKANKHTVADVLSWIGDRTATRFWMEPVEEGTVLVGTKQPTAIGYDAHYLGGDIDVINNDALVELTPVNTLVANGKAASSLVAAGDWELNIPDNTYWSVKARHGPLYKRAGETEYIGEPEFASGAESLQEVKNEAKSLLKQNIDQSTSGDIQTRLAAPVKPFDTLDALPTCDEEIATNQNPITYEIQRVHHKVRAGNNPENERTHTELNVGLHAAMDEIEVIEKSKKSV
ncbi:hypothetical protein [Haloarcula amylovorans]|uniref:hypothetical protein n=1 Tax=Haloarcula amylovorans TaxID=2562280 RepID=UPI001076525B|nr:hypothetical protein [Halomicroarcula amylolytica]